MWKDIEAAPADAILGRGVVDGEGEPRRWGVKTPQFSFMRLEGADPVTGVEMVSTGEVACFGEDFEANKAFLNSLGLKISKRMRNRIVGYITQLRQMSLQTSHQTAEEGGSITRP